MRPMNEQQLREEAERLINSGKMPTLDELCAAVLEARTKYANQIRQARREAREKVAVSVGGPAHLNYGGRPMPRRSSV
jgi:hypothetical protein